MAVPAHTLTLILSPEDLEAAIRRAVEPLRLEIERLKGEKIPELVSLEEAARRIGVSKRTVQRWVKERRDGLEEEWVGGARMVRLPPGFRAG